MGHEHNHTTESHHGSSAGKLRTVSIVNLFGFVLELIGGLLFGSITLLSDAFHMFFDATAYILAYSSAHFAENFEADRTWNFGLHRLETFSAFLNGTLLIPMAGYILWESYHRFLNPSSIGIIPTLAIGGAGLLINVVSALFLHGEGMSLNEKGAFYHLMGDAAGSIAVIISVATIHFTGAQIVDPIAAIAIALLIIWSAVRVIRGSTSILLQKSPIDSDALKEDIESLPNVNEVRDLRVWRLCSEITIGSAHVCDDSTTLEESTRTRRAIRELMRTRGVDHATIEMEGRTESSCHHEVAH